MSRELDAQVAEAMGRAVRRYKDGGISVFVDLGDTFASHIIYCPSDPGLPTWNPSADWAIAGRLVDLMAEQGYTVSVCVGPYGSQGNQASAMIMGFDAGWVAPTAPEAICRAFLAARGKDSL